MDEKKKKAVKTAKRTAGNRYSKLEILVNWLTTNKLKHSDIKGTLLDFCDKISSSNKLKAIESFIEHHLKNSIWSKLLEYHNTHYYDIKNKKIIESNKNLGIHFMEKLIEYLKRLIVLVKHKFGQEYDLKNLEHIDETTFNKLTPNMYLKNPKIYKPKKRTNNTRKKKIKN